MALIGTDVGAQRHSSGPGAGVGRGALVGEDPVVILGGLVGKNPNVGTPG